MLSFRNESGPVERDQSNGGGNPNDGQRMSVTGEVFDDGFGVSTPSAIYLHLGGRAERFTVSVGVDDETPDTSARVDVGGDERLLASGRVASGEPVLELDVDVTGVDVLTLSTREVAEAETPAHVDWASARITVTSTANTSVTPQPVTDDRAT